MWCQQWLCHVFLAVAFQPFISIAAPSSSSTAAYEVSCTLFERILSSESIASHEWTCQVSDGYMIDIDSSHTDFNARIEAGDVISGDSMLKCNKCVVSEQALSIPKDAQVNIVEVVNPVHRRAVSNVAKPYTTLIVSVNVNGRTPSIPGDDSKNTRNTLTDQVFGTYTKDKYCTPRRQLWDCSLNKVLLVPFEGQNKAGKSIKNGVYTLSVDVKDIDENNPKTVERNALFQLSQELDMKSFYELRHILMVLPSGMMINGEPWKTAYAYNGGTVSAYSDTAVNSLSVVIHEIGHNLGLHHSKKDEYEYGDKTGYMGEGYASRMTPQKCYNAAKLAQLGWYKDRVVQLELLSKSWRGNLYGIEAYDRTTSTSKMIIEIGQKYFVSFNRAAGINKGTGEGKNRVLIHKQDMRVDTRSELIMTLKKGEKKTIPNTFTTVYVHNIGESAHIDIQSRRTATNSQQTKDFLKKHYGFGRLTPPRNLPYTKYRNKHGFPMRSKHGIPMSSVDRLKQLLRSKKVQRPFYGIRAN